MTYRKTFARLIDEDCPEKGVVIEEEDGTPIMYLPTDVYLEICREQAGNNPCAESCSVSKDEAKREDS